MGTFDTTHRIMASSSHGPSAVTSSSGTPARSISVAIAILCDLLVSFGMSSGAILASPDRAFVTRICFCMRYDTPAACAQAYVEKNSQGMVDPHLVDLCDVADEH